MISPQCRYKIYWFESQDTNMRAEILALWGLLWFTEQLYIDRRGFQGFQSPHKALEQQNSADACKTRREKPCLSREKPGEKNQVVDRLSKKGLHGVFGEMQYELSDGSGNGATGVVKFF